MRQFVVVQTAAFAATAARSRSRCAPTTAHGAASAARRPARFGRTGTRPLLDRRSGDGTTPAGVFPLGVVTAWDGQTFSIFGNQPDPGTLAPYRSVRYEDCWGAAQNTARYQHLVNRPTAPDRTSGCSDSVTSTATPP